MKRIMQSLRRWLRGSTRGGGDTLASLLLAAREDAAFRARLVFILRLPQAQRGPLITTALEEMALRGEPAAARDALRVLATDEGARLALQALDRE